MTNLRVPGPTPCSPEVLAAGQRQMINHRGPEFAALIASCTTGLKDVFQTSADLLILTASGTGGIEAAVVNTLSPGDRVLSVSVGAFGDRFASIAEAYGASVTRVRAEDGAAADPEEVRAALRADPEIKAALVTHNETSTGVTNDLPALAAAVKGEGRLLVVDAISSLGSLEFRTDAWSCDVAISGSQKGWGVPPGLAFISMSPAAWQAFEQARMPRFYWDLGKAKQNLASGQTPWTPAVSVMYGLEVALQGLGTEGVAAIWARHQRLGERCRAGVKALGLELLADEGHASNTVTAVRVPAGVDGRALTRLLRDEYDTVLAGGQGGLAGKIFRIGHLGHCSEADVDGAIAALREALPKLGFSPSQAASRA